jgi:kynurenine formamidase
MRMKASLYEQHEGMSRRGLFSRLGMALMAGLPSPFGPDDQRGAANRITPAKVLEAIRLVRQGKVLDFGRVYEKGMPVFGNRVFALFTPSTGGPFGENKTTYNDELVTSQIGQVGTQFDGLAHVGIGDTYYNNTKLSDMVDPAAAGGAEGFKKLGVHHVGPIVTRGVLIDVAGYKGVAQLPPRYEITPADLEDALRKARLEIRPADAVYIHTGWGSLWMKDNATFISGEPGIGIEAGRWLASRQIVLCGSDNWAIEVVPNPNPQLAFPVHQEFIPRHGIYNHENCATEVLVQNEVREFLLMFMPLKLKGATGSPGAPIAVV